MIEKINKFREYLDYIEEHYNNVQEAWSHIQNKCSDMKFVYDKSICSEITARVKAHDESKLSAEEFTQYRNYFYPCDDELKNKESFNKAYDHHKKENRHHWENWARQTAPWQEFVISCVHMVIDWHAMSVKFGDTAKEYYEKNKDKIDLVFGAEEFIYKIFDRIY